MPPPAGAGSAGSSRRSRPRRPWPRDAAGADDQAAIAVNLAFTADGLRACGLPAVRAVHVSARVPGRHRLAGTVEDSRRHRGERAGGMGTRRTRTEPVHAIVIIHARDDVAPRCGSAHRSVLRIQRTKGGVVEHAGPDQRGYRPGTDTEPFGFRDGIAQPAIAGLDGQGVPTGEFILGYPNHYDVIPPSPAVRPRSIRRGILPPLDNPYHGPRAAGAISAATDRSSSTGSCSRTSPASGARCATRRVRQRGAADAGYMIWLASKMVGRWPSGAPLVEAPDARSTRASAIATRSSTAAIRTACACPIGAHVRRTQSARRFQAVSSRAVASHVRSAPAPEARARLRTAALRRGAPARPTAPVDRDAILSTSKTTGGARHPFLLRERQHPQPVRVRPADLVQQPELRRAVGQQGSDRWRSRASRRAADAHGRSRSPTALMRTDSVAAFRHGSRRRVSVHAEPHRTPLSRSGLVRMTVTRAPELFRVVSPRCGDPVPRRSNCVIVEPSTSST